MILRQFTVRHGRSVLALSARSCRRAYASEVDPPDSAHRQSERDHKPQKVIPGHPDEPSSILDTTSKIQTPVAKEAATSLEDVRDAIESIEGEINAVAAGQNQGVIPNRTPAPLQPEVPDAPFNSLQQMYDGRKSNRKWTKKGSVMQNVYHPWTIIQDPPAPEKVTLTSLLANQTHLGHATALWNPQNSNYIFGIRDGIHIISLEITLAYLRRAAKVVQEIARRGGIILFVGTRKGQQDIIIKAAKRAGAYHIFDKWRPGSLTNGQQILGNCAVKVVDMKDKEILTYRESLQQSAHPAIRPDLLICMNPLENEVCLHECSLYNIPTIGVIDTDADPSKVTYPIPANDDSLRSIALLAGTLSRAGEEGQRLRLEAAGQGRTTYNTAGVNRTLKNIEEIASLDVRDASVEDQAER